MKDMTIEELCTDILRFIDYGIAQPLDEIGEILTRFAKQERRNNMKLKEGELRIFYHTGESGIDAFFEGWMETALKAFGYKRWASGMEIETGVRDIAFEKIQEPEGE